MSNQVTSAQPCVTGVSNQSIFQDFFNFPWKIMNVISSGIESIMNESKSSNAGTITGSAPPPGPASPPLPAPPIRVEIRNLITSYTCTVMLNLDYHTMIPHQKMTGK